MFAKATPAVFALVLMAQAFPAHAASTSDAGAAQLKKQIEDGLALPLSAAQTVKEGLALSGAVEVAPKGDYYEVKLPGASFVAPQGLKFDFGTIMINVTPGDTGEYTTALSLPVTTKVYDSANAPLADITLGSQHFTGTWWPALAAFTMVDSDYKDILVKSATPGDFTVAIANVHNVLNLTKNADDTWSGPNSFQASDIKLSFASHGGGEGTIATINTNANSDKMNLKARKDMQDKLALQMQAATANPAQTPEQKSAAMASMLDNVQGFVDGLNSQFEATNIHFHANGEATPATPAQPGRPAMAATPAEPVDFTLAKLGSAFDVKGLQTEKGSSNMKLKLDALKVTGADPVIAGMIPSDTSFEIYFDNLPMQTLGKQLSDVFSDVVANAAAANVSPSAGTQLQMQHRVKQEVMGLMMTLPQALIAAGSSVAIRNTHSNSAEVQSTLDGEVHASMTSPLHAEGTMTLALSGIDELILKLQALAQQPNANPKLVGYATMLSMVQTQTQAEKGPDGKSLRKMKLELTPQGMATMNGQPIGGARMAPTPQPV